MELSNWRGSEGLTHRVFCLKCPSVSDRHRLEICRLNILWRSHLSSVAGPLLTEHLLSSHTRILSLERHQRRQWEFSLSSLQAPHGVLGYSHGQLARTLGPARPRVVRAGASPEGRRWLHSDAARLVFSNHTLHFMEWPVLQLGGQGSAAMLVLSIYGSPSAPQVGIDISIQHTSREERALGKAVQTETSG